MEQNLEHDNSMQKNFSERVVSEHRGKSNKCNPCDYASYHASDLKKHFKIHNGEMSNKCNQCEYGFSDPRSLRSHLKTHSGEKNNKCNKCDFATIHAVNLRAHLKHCQRNNGPMGWDHNWRHLIASKFSKHKQMVPHAFVWNSATRWRYLY